MITVFTPTYNRAHLLGTVFDSLQRQTYKDFEWVIVDDGSTDDTSVVVEELKTVSVFPICYIKKENGGKHTAINRGVNMAKGDLFFIVDSDDELPPSSLATIASEYDKIKDYSNFGGVCGYIAHRDGTVIGKPLINADATTIELRYRFGVEGDMREIYKTDVLKEFPFPEFVDEKFCPEILVWNRIAQKYKLRIFDKVIYLADYLDGGLTSKIFQIRKNSPKATCMCYAEMMRLSIPWKYRIKAFLNYWRFKVLSAL